MRALKTSLLTGLLAAVALTARADGTRFEANGYTLLDKKTGLLWQRLDSNAQTTPWYQALDNCQNLRLGDHNDWRLPTAKELMSFFSDAGTLDALAGEPSQPGNGYWSSTVTRNPNQAWAVKSDRLVRTSLAYGRCVRVQQ